MMSTQAPNNQFYLDRQGSISIFHQKLGLIITGANSKRQPALATFSENLAGQAISHADQYAASDERARRTGSRSPTTHFSATSMCRRRRIPRCPCDLSSRSAAGRGRIRTLTLQLKLKAGRDCSKPARVARLLRDRNESSSDRTHWAVGSVTTDGRCGSIQGAPGVAGVPVQSVRERARERARQAVGALSYSVKLKPQPGKYIRANEQEITFVLEVM